MKKLTVNQIDDLVEPSLVSETFAHHTINWQTAEKNSPNVPINKILSLSKKLMTIPSVSGDIEKALESLAVAKGMLTDYPFTPYVSNSFPSLLYSNKPDTTKFKIILNAHLDVVPGDPSQYQPAERNGKLYGRGAYDMKAAAAVMIILFKEMANKIPYPLGLQLVTEEELVDGDGTAYQLAQGVRTDFAIIGECGSNMRIIHETKGIVTAKISTSGHAAHGAYPWKGKNAVLRMYDVLNKIHQEFPVPVKETDETTVTVTKIETTNETWNKVPDDCTAVLDIRFNKIDKDTILDRLKSVLPEDVLLQVHQTRNNHYTDPNNQYLQQLAAAGEQVLGHTPPIVKTFGGSDTTYFSDVGCDAVEFGPVGHGQHHDDEWVDVKSLEVYYTILKNFLLSVK